LWGNMGRSR
jgi:hypothetical protein